jgi:hypothetical protein
MIFESCDTQTPTMDDAPVPPPLPILRCEHGVEAHVKQSRHPLTAASAYYCCRYTVVSN